MHYDEQNVKRRVKERREALCGVRLCCHTLSRMGLVCTIACGCMDGESLNKIKGRKKIRKKEKIRMKVPINEATNAEKGIDEKINVAV